VAEPPEPHAFAPYGLLGSSGLGWPSFAETWLGGPCPAGRGLPPEPEPGWTCGCGRGYNPKVMQCYHCPEPKAQASRDLTWSPDAAEPDGS
jgi:hypothetical protein